MQHSFLSPQSHSTGGFPEALPPLPRTTRLGHVPHPTHHHHHHHHGNHVSVCVVPTTTVARVALLFVSALWLCSLWLCHHILCILQSQQYTFYIKYICTRLHKSTFGLILHKYTCTVFQAVKPELRDTPPLRPLETDADVS